MKTTSLHLVELVGNIDRGTGAVRQAGDTDSFIQKVEKSHRPVVNQEEQLTRLRGQHDYYYGVRVTRARCQPAIELLDVIYSFDAAPSLPLQDCTDTCICQYQGVRNWRCGPRRLGPADRRKTVREDGPARRLIQGRRNTDSGFVFCTTGE